MTQALGVTEVTMTLGAIDTVHGTMEVTTTDSTAATTADTIAVSMIHGITDTTLGITADGTAVIMTLGTMATTAMPVSTTHTITICTRITADGMAPGILTSEEFTTGHIMEADT